MSKCLKFCLSQVNRSKKAHLLNIENKHKGEECYLFGDGGSLKYFDLSKFNNMPGIATNNLMFHKDFNKLKIRYYCIYEPYWFLPFFVSGMSDKKNHKRFKLLKNKIQKKHRKEAKNNQSITFLTDISNSLKFKGKNVLYISDKIVNSFTSYDFISHRINCFEGSLRVQIMLAIYLGFKKVYLVGHDYTHKNSPSQHFYGKGKGVNCNKILWNNDFFKIAKNYIDIETITKNGVSKTLKHITYHDFTGQELNYKENHEIVSKENREILKSWPWYQID